VRVADRRPMAEINVTPFVDVVLVLLIIFMLTAPLLGGGIDVDLPKAKAGGIDLRDELSVTLTRQGKLYINETEVPRGAFIRTLKDAFQHTVSSRAFLRADEGVPYGLVVEILGLMKDAGIEHVGLITRPVTGLPDEGEKKDR
jgi:biopolymer transport protein TolR